MTNPRLPKPLTHSLPTPPTPPPAKQIHISHKTPSLSTTPRISITTRTSNAAEPPVPVSSPSATNTQVTLNTTIATPIATALPTQTHHTDRLFQILTRLGQFGLHTLQTPQALINLAVITREISSFCRLT